MPIIKIFCLTYIYTAIPFININNIVGFKEKTVCEDETEAYNYWKNNFNVNKNDCCNLRK